MNTNISFDKASSKYTCNIDGTSFKTAKKDYIEYMFKKITGVKKSFDEITGTVKEVKSDRFCINQRFSFVEKLISMVASGVQPSAVITGQGGLGKTYTVTKTLVNAGYKDASTLADFQVGQVVQR